MTSDLRDIAWLAGFVDGEGAIGLHRNHDKRKTEGYYTYRPALQIVNTSAEAIDEVRRIMGFGQILTFPDGRKAGYKPLHRFVCRNRDDLIDGLSTLSPHLIVKRPQAELLLEYLRGRVPDGSERGWFKPITQDDLDIWARLRELNARGIPAQKNEAVAA